MSQAISGVLSFRFDPIKGAGRIPNTNDFRVVASNRGRDMDVFEVCKSIPVEYIEVYYDDTSLVGIMIQWIDGTESNVCGSDDKFLYEMKACTLKEDEVFTAMRLIVDDVVTALTVTTNFSFAPFNVNLNKARGRMVDLFVGSGILIGFKGLCGDRITYLEPIFKD